MISVILVGLSTWIALDTTRRVARYGASGMTAGMAAMMAAMGTGLSMGYAAGMIWDLGWATLIGVLAGGVHGLVMGRRFGPMAALDGSGGGVMGGLMGPMLAIMLLYLPLSLLGAAFLMLALQAAFGIAAVYLVAAAAGAVGPRGFLHVVGRLLGAHNVEAVCCPEEVAPSRPAAPASPKRRKPQTPTAARSSQSGSRILGRLVGIVVVGAFVLLIGGLLFGSPGAVESEGSRATSASQPTLAAVGPDGVQQVTMSLRYPRYEPSLVQVQAGVPVRLTLQAIGEPG